MKLVRYLSVLVFLIILVIIFLMRNKNEFSIRYEYIGAIKINTNVESGQNINMGHIIDHNHDWEQYPLRHIYLHEDISDLEEKFDIELKYDFNPNKFYLYTYGRKINNIKILFKYDEEDSDYLRDYYYAKIEYDKEINNEYIYIYEINKVNLIYKEMTTIDSFCSEGEIEFVRVDNDTIDLHIFRKGDINPLFEDMAFNRNDTTTENKVYYYRYEEPYLYTINKWNRYTVINTENKEIIVRTNKLENMSDEFKEVFADIETFIDISNYDKIPKDNAIEFGDGTIYIQNIKGINFVKTEKIYENILYDSVIVSHASKFSLIGSKLYLIDKSNYCYVIDIGKYEMILSKSKIDDLSEDYKQIFINQDNFQNID